MPGSKKHGKVFRLLTLNQELQNKIQCEVYVFTLFVIKLKLP